MLLRHLTRLRHQARLAHLPDGQQQVVHLTCREVEILRLISQRVDDLELLVDVEGGVEGAVGGGGGDGPGHALVARRKRVLRGDEIALDHICGIKYGLSHRNHNLKVNLYLLDSYLKRIIKFHVPVSLSAVGVGYDGGVVTHVVVQAECDSDPWPGDG